MSPSETPLLDAWGASLRWRPFLWIAPCVVAGSALGFQLALVFEASTPATRATGFFTLVGAAIGFLLLSILWSGRHLIASRVALGAFCFLAMSAYAARRVLPPEGDVSFLTTRNLSRLTPLHAPMMTLRGFVAGHPQRGEFSTQFPLECVERDDNRKRVPASGRVWISAPPNARVEVGDAIQIQGELRALPHATNLGQREERWRLVLENCWSRLRVDDNSQIRRLRARPRFVFERRVANWRSAILAHYQNAFAARGTPYPRANAQLLTAMTFGEGGLSTPLPRRVREEFRFAGLSHVLVASGTQIAFCAALLLGLGKVLGLRGAWLLALVAPPLFIYAAIAGDAPSIMRALVAGVLITIAVLIGRESDGLTLWSLALVTLAILDPAQLLSLSLQLSFAAAWGMIALSPILRRQLHRAFGGSATLDLMAFSLAAQMGVLPILLYHFGRFSVAGFGANLLGVPLAGVLVATGIAGLVLPLAWLNEFLTLGVSGVAQFFARLPGAQIETPPLRLAWTLACYAALLAALILAESKFGVVPKNNFQAALRLEISLWLARRRARLPRPQSVLVAAIFLATLWFAFQEYQARRPQLLRIALLDVGQGESIAIISPQGRTVLIDGGGEEQNRRANVGQSVIVPYLQARGVRKIDVLVITHADADHCNGLLSVLREVPVGLVIDGAPSQVTDEIEYLELKREIARRKIPRVPARAGQKINLGAATMQVLAPLPPLFEGDNNNCAVLRLDDGKISALFTGDIEKEAEERLVRRGKNVRCTILKVAHHGSQTSTASFFLKAARPQVALISSGRYNRFGHPAAGVLQRLSNAQVPVFRTDLDGAIEVASDGKKCWIETMNN
jgi:competence protein ComEC